MSMYCTYIVPFKYTFNPVLPIEPFSLNILAEFLPLTSDENQEGNFAIKLPLHDNFAIKLPLHDWQKMATCHAKLMATVKWRQPHTKCAYIYE